MFACNINNSKIQYLCDAFYVIISIMSRECYFVLFLYHLFFLVLLIVYFYVSHCCVIGCMHISHSYIFIIKYGFIIIKCSYWSLFMFLGLNSSLSKIMTPAFFFLIWNFLAYPCPLFYCFRLHFLYTAYSVTFFANCDGLHVVKSASILAKFSAKHFHISLFMVIGKTLPIRGTCINLKDQNEREDIIHLRLFQPDIVALKKFLSTSKNYQFLHYRLR